MRTLPIVTATLLALGLGPLTAHAQGSGNRDYASSRSWVPFTSFGYAGGSVGQSSFDPSCTPGFSCSDNGTGFKLYTGGQLWQMLGLEVGYVNLGKFERAGGSVKAQGLNVSLIGNIPFNEMFSAFGKVGTTYGYTKTTATAPGVNTGSENGFGASYGAGLAFDVSKMFQIVAEWDKYRFRTVNGREYAQMYSVGLRYKF